MVIGKLEINFPSKRIEQKSTLSPSSVDFIPVYGLRRESTKSEGIDCSEMTTVPDVECGVEGIGFLQTFRLRFSVTKFIFQTRKIIKMWSLE